MTATHNAMVSTLSTKERNRLFTPPHAIGELVLGGQEEILQHIDLQRMRAHIAQHRLSPFTKASLLEEDQQQGNREQCHENSFDFHPSRVTARIVGEIEQCRKKQEANGIEQVNMLVQPQRQCAFVLP